MAEAQRFHDLLEKHLSDQLTREEYQEFMRMVDSGAFDALLKGRIEGSLFQEGNDVPLHPGRAQEILEKILVAGKQDAQVVPLTRKPVRYWRWLVAASVILALSIGLFRNSFKPGPQPVSIQNKKEPAGNALAKIRQERNTSGKEKRIQLPDGSLVVLAPESVISYPDPFTGKRAVTLMGKAYFKVARDKTRPFTVLSSDLATTALGTAFTVTAFDKEPHIRVRLFEGRVVVKSAQAAARRLRKDYYLQPGEELVYETKNSTASVSRFADAGKPGAAAPTAKGLQPPDDPSVPENERGSWYMFTNQSLAKTFDQLEALFQVKIVYQPKDVRNIYFTGKYDRSDSLEIILRDIAAMHHLKFSKKDTAYIISR